ncbi:MAG: glycosyl hydrolase [Saprospiraceae bacterium]
MGTTGGGVWKTTDAGLTWLNISDTYFQTGSIGAIAVAPSDPNILYVGTGEHPVRGVMTSHGDGVYKSTDAGKTWVKIGLEESKHIAAISIHPDNPDVVYVAVQGTPYAASGHRGIYKTSDGGKTWDHLFFINDFTGAADLSMDPSNPRILYAALWDHHRQPWQIRSGGEGSGLYKSIDGGLNWQKMYQGLPAEMGKAGIAVSPANPKIVYANIEAEQGGVFRSMDAGESWTQVNKERVTFARAWYYMEIVPDPTDPFSLYVLNAPLLYSNDGGTTFTPIKNPHSDQHALWINPQDPSNMILGNDGGACVTFNGGITWSSQMNQPTGQFYRVLADKQFPFYHIYGGQQDHNAIAIASRTQDNGIGVDNWYGVAGGESAFVALDPNDPQFIYGGSYQGNIEEYIHQTGETKDIMAYPIVGLATLPRDMKYRFNWNAPIVASPQDPRVLYHAAQKVLRSRDRGLSWQEISPDLTRNEPEKQGPGGIPFINEGAGGENYNTISYLACSPHESWVIWVGTDDGLVHLTQDEGYSWQNVTPPDLGEALINCIEVSPHDPATAYVVATRYKFNDFTPLIYRTRDFGKTWTLVTRYIGPDDFVRVVREDPLRKDMLYAGTETGLYISYNGGNQWAPFRLNLPKCPITDLAIANNDLIAATAGRGFWILDDLGFLQQSAGYLLTKTPQIFQPRPAYRIISGSSNLSVWEGQNPPEGMIIDYFLPEQTEDQPVWLDILDVSNQVMRTFSSEKTTTKPYVGGPEAEPTLPKGYGIHRFSWDLRRDAVRHLDSVFMLGDYQGAMVPPGDYTIRLRVGNQVAEETVQVLPDPRIKIENEAAAYAEQDEFLHTIENTVSDIHHSVEVMRDLQKQMDFVSNKIKQLNDQQDLLEKATSIKKQAADWEAQLVQAKQQTFQDVINFPNQLNAELMDLHKRCSTPNPLLTAGAKLRLQDLLATWQVLAEKRDFIIFTEMAAFNQLYSDKNLPAIFLPGPKERAAW